MGVEIFSKENCKYCEYAEQMCKDMNLEYKNCLLYTSDAADE